MLKAHETQENNTAFIHQFRHLSSNNVHLKEIDALYADINRIQPNNKVPDVALHCTKGKKTLLKDICKGKQQVVFYFWSGTQKRHFNNISRHVKNLERKHPKKKFVGINVKTDSLRWLSMVNASLLNEKNQFRTSNYDEIAHAMGIYDINKGFVVENGVIIDAFANLYTSF